MVESTLAREIAIIFKRKFVNDSEYFIPFKVVKGTFDDHEFMFIDSYGNSYHHMVEEFPGNCFAFRSEITALMGKYDTLNINEIKKKYLEEYKKNNYFFDGMTERGLPKIIKENKITHEVSNGMDKDGEKIYNSTVSMTFETSFFDTDEEDDDNNIGVGIQLSTFKENKKELSILLPKEEDKLKINTKEIYEELKSKIIGQDDAIKKILGTIWFNYTNVNLKKVQNIFVNGPTGVGKTEIFRLISNMIDVPCVIEDVNEFTMEGYVGRSVKEILNDLISKANGDIKKASNGIIVLDEIDKLAGTSSQENISTTAVQDALLKIIEDGDFSVKINGKTDTLNTRKITVAALGAFSNIEATKVPTVGFEGDLSRIEYKNVTLQDFEKYGMKAEFLGRFSSLVKLNELTEENLFEILKYSKISPLLEVIDFYSQHNINLLYNDEVLEIIAKEARKLKTGARSISTILNNSLVEALLEISFNPNLYNTLEILPETVTNNKAYRLTKK